VHLNFARALFKVPDRRRDAVAQLREVLRLQPDNTAAAEMLGRISPNGP
jgi:hypothetical protein